MRRLNRLHGDFFFVSCLVAFFSLLAQLPEERKQVKGIVGGSVTFPAPVQTGTLQHKELGNAAIVLKGSSETEALEQFKGRLQWDSQTGLFTITHLRTDDSGIYVVDSSDQQKKRTTFQLEVYKHVSTPTVTWLQLGRNCSVLCSVENGRELTLSWQRDGEMLSNTSSPDINGSLSLPLEIDNKRPFLFM
ncbi:hypothetical protein GJAV_G00065790 [Gymnothorax javanicus]|nr:hypothetical protein GJAV_G00065790 [Gymnothorax javanicus]